MNISRDNDIVVSGSRDKTIRLWYLQSGSIACVLLTEVGIFNVKISDNKETIVAVGDKDNSKKLVLIRVVNAKPVQ